MAWPRSWRRPTSALVFFTEKIAHPNDGIDLFGGEPRQQIPSNGFRMYRPGSIELFSAEFGKDYENSFPVSMTALNERSFLHSRQLMREAAFVPSHHAGQRLLSHLTFAKGSEARQDSKLRTCNSGRLRDVPPDATQHIFTHEKEGMPDAKLTRG
jgi:hypothetical protein